MEIIIVEGIVPSDRYVNHNNKSLDLNMCVLDGLHNPGTGCLVRRTAPMALILLDQKNTMAGAAVLSSS